MRLDPWGLSVCLGLYLGTISGSLSVGRSSLSFKHEFLTLRIVLPLRNCITFFNKDRNLLFINSSELCLSNFIYWVTEPRWGIYKIRLISNLPVLSKFWNAANKTSHLQSMIIINCPEISENRSVLWSVVKLELCKQFPVNQNLSKGQKTLKSFALSCQKIFDTESHLRFPNCVAEQHYCFRRFFFFFFFFFTVISDL